jgi:diguanylate cyclase (GGDEF)-like protein
MKPHKRVLKPYQTKAVVLIGLFLALAISLNFMLLGILLMFENQAIKIQKQDLLEEQILELEIEAQLLGSGIDYVLSDVTFLAENYGYDLADAEALADIAEQWALLVKNRQVYDQIRYIDSTGQEVIRVNLVDGEAVIVQQEELQNKSDRYYFTETIRLEEGQIFVSRLDLNVENGEIEQPIKPMVRFATPIYTEAGAFNGILILNYLAEDVLNEIDKISELRERSHCLLDKQGYWLATENESLEWGFMYEDKQDVKFDMFFPDEWAMMTEDEDQFETENGLFAYINIDLNSSITVNEEMFDSNQIISQQAEWILVSVYPIDGPYGYLIASTFAQRLGYVIKNYLHYALLVTGASYVIAFLLIQNKRAHEKVLYYSEIDTLTGVLNRRAGLEKLTKEIDKSRLIRSNLCIIYVDINGLKEVNDTLGHDMGDELITSVVQVISETIRKEDYIARLGGDEFIIVCYKATEQDAESIWQRVNEAYKHINETENRDYLISASHGVVEVDKLETKTLDELMQMSDYKMYEEKRKIKQHFSSIRNEQGEV